jgi:uncharacterized protein (TIGR02246 family)
MPANKPSDLHPLFEQAFNAQDADALLALYQPDAVLVPEPGSTVQGHDAIREALGGFLALKGTIKLDTVRVYEAGALALLHGHWTLKGSGPDGSPVEIEGRSSEVVAQQPDGTWLYTLDNPFSDA